jgi:RNA polymerase sigma factor (sigma-70 family)
VPVAETDAQLVARCRTGDDDAWRELVDRFSRYVYAISVQAFRLPEADAEDVFQEVFARAYQNLPKLRNDAAIRPWLAQLTRRLCLDTIRAGAREQPGEIAEPFEVDDTIARLDESLYVNEALATLPSDCREELPVDRRRPRHPGRHDREPHLPLPRQAPHRARGKKSGGCGVWWLITYA